MSVGSKHPRADEEGSGEMRTSGVMPRTRLESWRVPGHLDQTRAVELDPLTASDVALTAAELSRGLAGAASEAELAHSFVHIVGRALPRRFLALRLEAPGAPAIACNGAPLPGSSSLDVPLRISRAGAELFMLEDHVAASDTHTVVCPEADHGFDVPIVLDGRLSGVLNVEYPAGARGRTGELAPILSLASLLTLAMETVRTRRERDGDRDQVKNLVRNTTLPAFLLNASGDILAASEGAAELLQRPAQELVGQSVEVVASEDTRAMIREGLRRTGEGEVVGGLDMRTARGPSGIRVIWTAVPAQDADGKTRTTLAIGEDLTDLVRLEDQILHAEKLATLGQLAAGVVHELNNPLTSISVYTDYLLQRGKRVGGDPADLERLGRIAEAAARMLRFTRDLVTYARPSTEEPSAVPIPEVLAQSAGFCEHVLREANVTLTLKAASTLPPARGLRGQLQQVFVNLFTNAAHAIAESGHPGTIDVSATVVHDEIEVAVEDNGPGIRTEHRTKIFEPFFSTKTEGKGTGLGLSIVRNIVRLHGGSIEIQSRHAESGHEHTGSRFVVRLPLFL